MAIPAALVRWTYDDADTSGSTLDNLGTAGANGDGTLINSPTTGVASPAGEAYQYDGDAGKRLVQILNAQTAGLLPSGDFAIAVVAQCNSDNNENWLFGLGHDTDDGIYIRRDSSNQLSFVLNHASETREVKSASQTFTSGEWFCAICNFVEASGLMSLRARKMGSDHLYTHTVSDKAITYAGEPRLECAARDVINDDKYWFGLTAEMRFWHQSLSNAEQTEFLDLYCGDAWPGFAAGGSVVQPPLVGQAISGMTDPTYHPGALVDYAATIPAVHSALRNADPTYHPAAWLRSVLRDGRLLP